MPAQTQTHELSRLTRHKNPNHVRDGRKAWIRAVLKYNIEPTTPGPILMVDVVEESGSQSILAATGHRAGGKARKHRKHQMKDPSTGQTGEIPAEARQNDSEWLVSVPVGTPPQNLLLDFDTGSADLWVWSTELPASTVEQAGKNGVFNPKNSSTFKPSEGESWKIEYGDGSSAYGNVGTDVINLGGLIIQNQVVECATHISRSFQQNTSRGLLGLASGKINTVTPDQAATPMDNLVASQAIPQTMELFTAQLSPIQGQGFYSFGFIDQNTLSAFGGSIHYVDVNFYQGFWQFNSPTATVNGKVMTMPTNCNTAIADTGTSLLLLPNDIVAQVYKAIAGAYYDDEQQGWLIPITASHDQLPSVNVSVGSTLFGILPSALLYAQVTGKDFKKYYYGGIQSCGNLGFCIFGDTFLQGCYVIFDLGNSRLGVAQSGAASSAPGS